MAISRQYGDRERRAKWKTEKEKEWDWRTTKARRRRMWWWWKGVWCLAHLPDEIKEVSLFLFSRGRGRGWMDSITSLHAVSKSPRKRKRGLLSISREYVWPIHRPCYPCYPRGWQETKTNPIERQLLQWGQCTRASEILMNGQSMNESEENLFFSSSMVVVLQMEKGKKG